MQEALAHIVPGTLLILDTDSTILTTPQMLGNDAWLKHYIRAKTIEHVRSGVPQEEALRRAFEEAFSIWARVHQAGVPVPVEFDAPQRIRELQDIRVPMMVLSAAKQNFMVGRRDELGKLGLDLALTAPFAGRIEISPLIEYSDGILLTSFQDKGAALLRFFEMAGWRPQRIVFVDDDLKNNESVDRAMIAAGIETICFRYGVLDPMYPKFDPDVAQRQLDRFLATGRLLSDDEARLNRTSAGLNHASIESDPSRIRFE
ncbi:MAG: DUF2608 domain-containing protein [Elusimicrobia bacterium]|nr:DUF2608 domain-containing protein [Elusimicrobiota bacterium]